MISKIIMFIMAIFALIAAIDRVILNNKLGFGSKFDEGMEAMGVMATSMVGLMCLAPVLGKILSPIVSPGFRAIGADPSMLAGSLLAIDMGGYPLAQELTNNPDIAVFSGGLYASMMGVCITFAIPVALGIIEKEDHPYLAKGVMCGIIVIPIASFIGGIMMGLEVLTIIKNLIPAIVLSILLSIGLVAIPEKLMKGFQKFALFITVIVYLSLAVAIFQALTGVEVIKGMAPIGPQLETVGIIGITLAGAYPFVDFITRTFNKPLSKFGSVLGVNEIAMAGIIACVANSLPMLAMVKDMDSRGKTMAMAFMVPAAFALGDHLAYASANMPDFIGALIATKLIGGILAIIVAMFLTKNMDASKN